MGIGKMKQRVTFYLSGKMATETGGATDVLTKLTQVRGQMRKKRGGRNLSFGDIVSEEGWELKVRYSDAIAAVLDTNLKVSYNSSLYTVTSWTMVQEREMYYLIDLTIDKKA